MDKLVDRVMDAAYKSYLEWQCIPNTVEWELETMLQMVQMGFMPQDEGETHLAEDPMWAKDEEPSPCAIDSWAQGAVPVLHVPALVGLQEIQGKYLYYYTPKPHVAGDRPETKNEEVPRITPGVSVSGPSADRTTALSP
ncbi:Uncharacterized protein Cadr_000007923 [Camelus dromedarius]|uniref:Uncharacterized protein n=1 Tax=Camelus dromedarius TaxID=9838 RepID=A0A5N4DZR1_CAMDR|nr:Uncharacterized protein Cadr_000007923 [Camelus dromedarius]